MTSYRKYAQSPTVCHRCAPDTLATGNLCDGCIEREKALCELEKQLDMEPVDNSDLFQQTVEGMLAPRKRQRQGNAEGLKVRFKVDEPTTTAAVQQMVEQPKQQCVEFCARMDRDAYNIISAGVVKGAKIAGAALFLAAWTAGVMYLNQCKCG